MECRYCHNFVCSVWRIGQGNPDSKKKLPDLRHCSYANKYISGEKETCEHFNPHNIFWCEKNECFLHTDACPHRRNVICDPDCSRCWQYTDIVELQRARKFFLRKLAALEAEKPPVLLRRKK